MCLAHEALSPRAVGWGCSGVNLKNPIMSGTTANVTRNSESIQDQLQVSGEMQCSG